MNYFKILFILFVTLISCKKEKESRKEYSNLKVSNNSFVIAFGSCNNQVLPNTLWKEIKKNKPNVWIWGGDIIYSDTEDMSYLEQNYLKQKTQLFLNKT